MRYEDREVGPAAPEAGLGLSRRGLLRGAAGLGIAGVAAGLLVDVTADTASAATVARPTTVAAHPLASAGEPLVAHLYDARTGEVDLFTGEQHLRVYNPALAHALAQAATTGHRPPATGHRPS